MAKIKHKPRSRRSEESQEEARPEAERVHCDTQGPIIPPSPSGNQFSQTQFEQLSEYLSVFEKQGTTAPECVQIFRKSYAGKKRPKSCKTDGGPEFSQVFIDSLTEWDIEHVLACANEPSTHGLIGVIQSQMNQAVRCMMYHSSSPGPLWGKCQKYYALARNVQKGSFKYKHGKSFKGKLVPFGCEAIYKIRDQESSEKFAPSGTSAVFVGYDDHGHVEVLDIEAFQAGRNQHLTRTVRSVRFNELEFPFAKFQKDAKEEFAKLIVGESADLCPECGLSLETEEITCPACKGRKRKHTRDSRCKFGRCRCKPSLEIIISGENSTGAVPNLSGGESDNDSEDADDDASEDEEESHEEESHEDEDSSLEESDDDAASESPLPSVISEDEELPNSDPESDDDSVIEDRDATDLGLGTQGRSNSSGTRYLEDGTQVTASGRVVRPVRIYGGHGVGHQGQYPTTTGRNRTPQKSTCEEFEIFTPPDERTFSPSTSDDTYASVCLSMDSKYVPECMHVTMDLTDEDRMDRGAELDAARKKEIDKHITEKSVDFASVREEDDVRKSDPRATFMKMKFVEAKSGIEMDGKGVIKARIVGQGCNHVDIDGHQVKLAEAGLYADPASLEEAMLGMSLAGLTTRVGKLKIEQKDRSSAYLKEKLLGDAVWMRLDSKTKKIVPGADRMKSPVVRAVGAIYGISRAGFDHESGRNKKIELAGWKLLTGSRAVWYQDFKVPESNSSSQMSEEWATMILVVYVDDFLLAGNEDCFEISWDSLKGMGWKPEPPDRYLGIEYRVSVEDGCNVIWLGQAEYSVYIKKNYIENTSFDRSKNLRNAKTPAQEWVVYSDEQLSEEGIETESFLRRMIGLLLYLARGTRPEIKYGTTRLSRMITKWTIACDLELRRLIGYLQWKPDWGVKLTLSPQEFAAGMVKMLFHVDADHGNSCLDRRSIAGMNFGLFGKKTKALIGGHSKANKAAERSSGGTEINGVSAGISTFYRFDDMWMSIAKKFSNKVKRSVVASDSAVAISVINAGYSKAYYHLSKHQGTDIAFVHDVFYPPDKSLSPLVLEKVASAENMADCNTKPLSAQSLVEVYNQIGVARLCSSLFG